MASVKWCIIYELLTNSTRILSKDTGYSRVWNTYHYEKKYFGFLFDLAISIGIWACVVEVPYEWFLFLI